MLIDKEAHHRAALWGLILAFSFAPTMIPAQEEGPATAEISTQENSPPDPPPNTNPTGRLIYPRKHQSEDQQQSDQLECYRWTCDQIGWDPYQAYSDLVDDGYAVALTWQEMERGLICLAAQGAEMGAVAGEIVGDPENGAEIGAAIFIASEIIHSSYLNEPDIPEVRRTISRYERNLRKWNRKYAGCLSRKGYRVPSS